MEKLKKQSHAEWAAHKPAVENARGQLPRLLEGYFRDVRQILAENPSPAELHKIRLATKRVRYTLELFRTYYGPGLEERLSGLRQIQRRLGEVNDAAATRGFLGKRLKHDARLPQIDGFLSEQAQAKADKFVKYWSEEFDAPGREAWWTTYLSRAARPKRLR